MPVKTKCPGCGDEHEVKGVVTRDTLREQVSAKDAEITQLKGALGTAQQAAGDIGAIRTERDQYKAKIEQMEQAAAIGSAFDAAGVKADDAVRSGFRALYDSAMAGKADDERVGYAEWIASDDAKNHPLLAGAYATAATTDGEQGDQGASQGDSSPGTGAKPPGTQGGPPSVNTGANPPAGNGQLKTAQDVATYFNSPAYRALPLAQQKQKRRELQGQFKLGGLFEAQTHPGMMRRPPPEDG